MDEKNWTVADRDVHLMRGCGRTDHLCQPSRSRHEYITEVSRAGADVLVAGSAVFKADDIPSAIRELTQKAELGTGTIV